MFPERVPNLRIFTFFRNIEDILAEKGEKFIKISGEDLQLVPEAGDEGIHNTT